MPVPACGNGRTRAKHPQARRSPLEVGVHPRAGRILSGISLLFFAGFKRDFPVVLGDPQGCPRQGYTGLTGALDRSDRCNPWWVFARVIV
jgi:hypothetical protein